MLTRELSRAAAESPLTVDLRFLPKALHDLGPRAMRERIQAEIDAVPAGRYDAVALGYGLCGTGVAGIRARSLPLVIPRAHDCIPLLLGDARTHERLVTEEPGTCFRSAGWTERAGDITQLASRQTGAGMPLEELVRRYGEDNGFYLYREFTRYRQSYSRLVFIKNGSESGTGTEASAREEADSKGWRFETAQGDMGWFHRLASGQWSNLEEFLVAQPGERIEARHDGSILAAVREVA